MAHPGGQVQLQATGLHDRSRSVRRWVAPVKADIPRTEHGLLDSVTLSRDWYVGDRPELADDLIGTSRSYVLLAPGGAGKTTLIEDLKRSEPDSISIDLRLDGQQALTDLLSSLRSTSTSASLSESPRGTVFIDAVDEALQVNPNIGYVLVQLLKRPGADRMAWRFACRPASWTADLANGVRAALPSFERLELLPLGRAEIEEMAGADSHEFLSAVDHHRLTRLLAHPLHASNLLDHWRTCGQLPASRTEAMWHAVTGMLAETSTTRLPGKLDDHQRLLVAERLAAIATFCGVGSFVLGPLTSQLVSEARSASGEGVGRSVLAVSSVPTRAEPDLSGTLLTLEDIREVLGTALFTAAEQGGVTFVHQSYADFLAAEYLACRGVSGPRLVSVLGADVNGLVPGSMIDVLGWLLVSGAQVPETLLTENAQQLLSATGLELVDDRVRERVVGALLHGAATGTVDEGWRADTSVLSHPGLAAQLHDAALTAANHWVIFWICRIARQCIVHEAADDLRAIAFEPDWPAPMRAEAVKAFATVVSRDRLTELVPLLDLGPDEDPHDEIHAAALHATIPAAVNFAPIQNALRPRRTQNLIGNYHQLLRELPVLVPRVQVPSTLVEVLHRRTEPNDRAFDRLIGGLLRRAWQLREQSIAPEIGAALGTKHLTPHQLFDTEPLPWSIDDDPPIRRAMAASALSAHEHAFATVLDLRLLVPADIGWLLDWMPTAPNEALETARVALGQLAWNVEDTKTAERIIDIHPSHPAHQTLTTFHGHRPLSARPQWLAQPENVTSPSPSELEAQLRASIARAYDDTDTWWDAVVALAGDRTDPDPEILFGWDLTSRPLWSTMTEEEQTEFLRLGLDYLHARQPDPDRWQGRNQWHGLDGMMPDWAAVFLIATLAAHRPDLLNDVDPTLWASWAAVITAMPALPGHGDWQQRIRDAAPEPGRQAIKEALRAVLEDTTVTSFAENPLADFSDSLLLTIIEQIARNSTEPASRHDEALKVLIDHAPHVALGVARAAIREQDASAEDFAVLALLAPDELVAVWITDGRLGPLERLRDLDPERLSDAALVALTTMLLDELSFAEHAELSDDFVERTPESVARRLRWRLLQTMAGRGLASPLAALREGRPQADQENIQYLLREARTREAMLHWRPLQPTALMDLLDRGDARLVRDSASLQAVLIEQLDQIQRDLQGRADFRSLWDGEPGNPGASPKGEDTISDWLAGQLRLRLHPHVVVDREIQVTRPTHHGIGTRIDLTTTSGGRELGRVIFEAKLVNNRSLLTAIDNQLIAQYMEPGAFTHGIYIVYWTNRALRPKTWHKRHPDADALTQELRAQARHHLPNKHIEVIVLDIGPPA